MGVGGLAHLHKLSYCFMSYHPVNHGVNECQITCTFWLLILSSLVSKLSFFTRTGVVYLLGEGLIVLGFGMGGAKVILLNRGAKNFTAHEGNQKILLICVHQPQSPISLSADP